MMPDEQNSKLADKLDYLAQLPEGECPYYSIILGGLFEIETDDAGPQSGEDLLSRCVLDTYSAIKTKTRYDFISQGDSQRLAYIIGYNILNRLGILDYGTSIRGAWLNVCAENKPLFDRLDVEMNRAIRSWNETHSLEYRIWSGNSGNGAAGIGH